MVLASEMVRVTLTSLSSSSSHAIFPVLSTTLVHLRVVIPPAPSNPPVPPVPPDPPPPYKALDLKPYLLPLLLEMSCLAQWNPSLSLAPPGFSSAPATLSLHGKHGDCFPTHLRLRVDASHRRVIFITGHEFSSGMGVNIAPISSPLSSSSLWFCFPDHTPPLLLHLPNFLIPHLPLHIKHLWAWPKMSGGSLNLLYPSTSNRSVAPNVTVCFISKTATIVEPLNNTKQRRYRTDGLSLKLPLPSLEELFVHSTSSLKGIRFELLDTAAISLHRSMSTRSLQSILSSSPEQPHPLLFPEFIHIRVGVCSKVFSLNFKAKYKQSRLAPIDVVHGPRVSAQLLLPVNNLLPPETAFYVRSPTFSTRCINVDPKFDYSLLVRALALRIQVKLLHGFLHKVEQVSLLNASIFLFTAMFLFINSPLSMSPVVSMNRLIF
ncbi:hypothetical protein AALP_AA3G149500 [Arabis alpina]|uniref:Uncharacterized protein n=1 Tax=Arabis alpina TaxID=50452 RepID=A0A087H9A6_ARAAL|nr:hypothetical protein AALP_AA3G149500 [Arabis alpina]